MTSETAPAFTAQAVPKALGFDPAKLNGLSQRLIQSHWENNYGGSVKALAVVKKRLVDALADKDFPPYVYNDLKREHLLRTGSVVFHEYYFDNLGGNGKPDAAIRTAIGQAFGDFDTWETEFRRIGQARGGGVVYWATTLIHDSSKTTGCGHTWPCHDATAGHGHVRHSTRWTSGPQPQSTSTPSFRTSWEAV
jgi:superoxide dismutase